MKKKRKQNMFRKMIFLNFKEGDLVSGLWKRIGRMTKQKFLIPEKNLLIKKNLDGDCLLLKLGMSADAELIDEMPNLKYIGMYGTGYGRIDTNYASESGITVCNIADYATEGVAEFVMACVLEKLREITRARLQAQQGNYSESTFTGSEIKNKKFGVIGFGHIGSRVADLAANGFHANVSYYNRSMKETPKSIVFKDLKTLLQESDIISLHLALNEGTNRFMSKELINKIKPNALVINTSPMELFDIDALDERLEKGDITFILDHSDELLPEDAKRLASHPNCIMYPPIGYTTKEATLAKKEIFVSNLENYLRGKPTNKVN